MRYENFEKAQEIVKEIRNLEYQHQRLSECYSMSFTSRSGDYLYSIILNPESPVKMEVDASEFCDHIKRIIVSQIEKLKTDLSKL